MLCFALDFFDFVGLFLSKDRKSNKIIANLLFIGIGRIKEKKSSLASFLWQEGLTFLRAFKYIVVVCSETLKWQLLDARSLSLLS